MFGNRNGTDPFSLSHSRKDDSVYWERITSFANSVKSGPEFHQSFLAIKFGSEVLTDMVDKSFLLPRSARWGSGMGR